MLWATTKTVTHTHTHTQEHTLKYTQTPVHSNIHMWSQYHWAAAYFPYLAPSFPPPSSHVIILYHLSLHPWSEYWHSFIKIDSICVKCVYSVYTFYVVYVVVTFTLPFIYTIASFAMLILTCVLVFLQENPSINDANSVYSERKTNMVYVSYEYV